MIKKLYITPECTTVVVAYDRQLLNASGGGSTPQDDDDDWVDEDDPFKVGGKTDGGGIDDEWDEGEGL